MIEEVKREIRSIYKWEEEEEEEEKDEKDIDVIVIPDDVNDVIDDNDVIIGISDDDNDEQ